VKLPTTVIGSYPAKPKKGDVDPFLHAIKIAVDDQLYCEYPVIQPPKPLIE